MNNSFDFKSEARALLLHAAKLLTGRHAGSDLPSLTSFVFWPLCLAYLFIAATARIVGHADAGPITALTAPIAWAGVLYFVGILRRDNVLPAFMVLSIAIDFLIIFLWAVQLNHIMAQWALESWRFGAIGYFAYLMTPQEKIIFKQIEVQSDETAPKNTDWKRNQYASSMPIAAPVAMAPELEASNVVKTQDC